MNVFSGRGPNVIYVNLGDMTNGFALNELKRQGSNFNGTTPSHHSIHSVNSLNQSQQMPSPTNSSASSSSVMVSQLIRKIEVFGKFKQANLTDQFIRKHRNNVTQANLSGEHLVLRINRKCLNSK
jgi:hypothetical protein